MKYCILRVFADRRQRFSVGQLHALLNEKRTEDHPQNDRLLTAKRVFEKLTVLLFCLRHATSFAN